MNRVSSFSRWVVCPSTRGLAAGLIPAGLALGLAQGVASAQPGSASLVDSKYLTTANTGPINPAQFTLEARFRPEGNGYGEGATDAVGPIIVSKPRQGAVGVGLESWFLSWSPSTGKVTFAVTYVFGASQTLLRSNTTVALGQSTHVAGTFDGATLRLYINGVLDSSVPAVSSQVYYNAGEPVLLGAGNFGFNFTRRFQGAIDDVRIWSTVRSAAEIQANSSCQLPSGPQPGLLAHWTFDDASPADQSGNARDASFLNGAPVYSSSLATSDRWTRLTLPTNPTSRYFHYMTYDSVRDRSVLWGGAFGPSSLRSDTWELDSAGWSQVATTLPVGGSALGGSAFDPARQRTIMFSGFNSGGFFPGTQEWNGSAWANFGGAQPQQRESGALAYDALRGSTLMFGGGGVGVTFGDTWRWNGAAWLQLPVSGPASRRGHVMAYDPVRERIVLFGGTNSNGSVFYTDTWEWDGAAWIQRTPVNSPPGRRFPVMAYDPVRRAMVLHGGVNNPAETVYRGDTWAWNGSDWSLIAAGGPTARRGQAMVYDPVRRGLLLFGGNGDNNTTVLNDTWLLPSPPAITGQPVSALNCGRVGAGFTVTVAGARALTYQWRFNGAPIDSTANPSAATASLSIASPQASDAGSYDCVISSGCDGDSVLTTAAVTLNVCPADFNCDGVLDPDDLADYIGCFFGPPCLLSDYNGDGFTDPDDLADYIGVFFAGC